MIIGDEPPEGHHVAVHRLRPDRNNAFRRPGSRRAFVTIPPTLAVASGGRERGASIANHGSARSPAVLHRPSSETLAHAEESSDAEDDGAHGPAVLDERILDLAD
jgi:hypothetical protein